ncbi:hemerythrin domain-containing protein [Yinghuangia aomiensis]
MENANAAKAPHNTARRETPEIDTHGMVVIHRGLRRESRLLTELIAAVAPGDTARTAVLADHLRDYPCSACTTTTTARTSTSGRRSLPVSDPETDLVLRMEAQHERVAATLDRVAEALPVWEATAGEAERDALVAILVEHRVVLLEHLDDEEAELLPLAARLLTQAEWDAMGEHFQQSTPKPKLLLFLGMALEEADAAERTAMLAGMPWFARRIWHAVGRPAYARRMRTVRQTA